MCAILCIVGRAVFILPNYSFENAVRYSCSDSSCPPHSMALPSCCHPQDGCVCARVTTAVLFIIWAVCWAIFMGVGYTLQHSIYPNNDNDMIKLGYIFSSYAGFAVGVYIMWRHILLLPKYKCNESISNVSETIILACALVMEILCVAFLCIVGGAEFIAGGNALKDYDPKVLAYGVSAGRVCLAYLLDAAICSVRFFVLLAVLLWKFN